MRALWLRLRLSNSNFGFSPYLYSSSSSPSLLNSLPSLAPPSASSIVTNLFTAPWSAFQLRGIKVSGSDIRVGNIIGKQGRIYEVELRDIVQGNKVTQRMGTDENIERVYVQEKTFIYICMDHDGTVVLMDPDALDQMEVSKELFGKNCAYLQEICLLLMNLTLLYIIMRNKKVVLDNGLTVEVPPHIVAGDAIVVNTEDDYYIERWKMNGKFYFSSLIKLSK